jgi:hypothetical protein
MKIRELLQTELWSKQTTRKFLVWSGSVLWFVFGVLALWIGVEWYWLTPGERNAGRVALAQIDVLQSWDTLSDSDFNAADANAKGSLGVARQAAWTDRDKAIAGTLAVYLEMIEMDRESMQRSKSVLQLLQQRNSSLADSEKQHAEDRNFENKKTTLLLRSGLHGELD